MKRIVLAAVAAFVLLPATGCGCRRCSNRCATSFAPPPPPPAYYCPPGG